MSKTRRRTRVARAVERVALGAVMGAIAFVLERRLLRTRRTHGATSGKRERGDVDLSTATKDVDQ